MNCLTQAFAIDVASYAITARQSPILKRLKIDPITWHQIATTFEDSAGWGRLGLGRPPEPDQRNLRTTRQALDLPERQNC